MGLQVTGLPAVMNGSLVSSATAAALLTSNPFFVFNPVLTAVPPVQADTCEGE